MAYTEIPTYVTNQLITAAHANTYWRDNVNELWPFTAKGDIAYASAASTLAALAKGELGQVLRAGASLPVYGSPLSCYGTFTITTPTSTSATNWSDIPGATVDIVVPCTSTLIAMATLQGSEGGDSSDEGFWRWMIDSEGQPETGLGYHATVRFPVSVIALKANIAAGTKTCKLQSKTTAGGKVGNRNIFGIVLGFAK